MGHIDSTKALSTDGILFIFVFYQRLDIYRACVYDNSLMEITLLAGGKDALLKAIQANRCREINNALLKIIGGK